MDTTSASNPLQSVKILLEVVPEDLQNPDIALISAIRDEAISTLERDGHEVTSPSYTGRKGPLTADVVTFLIAHKDEFDLLSDFSGISALLITISGGIIKLAKLVHSAYQRRVGANIAKQHPVTVTVKVQDIQLTVDNALLTKEEAEAIAQFAKELASNLELSAKRPLGNEQPSVQSSIPNKRKQHKK
jgi:hypothetical protein